MKLPLNSKRRRRPIQMSTKFVPTSSSKNYIVPIKPLSAFLITFLTILCLYLLFRSDIFLIREITFERETVQNYVELVSEDMLRDESVYWGSFSIFRFPKDAEAQRLREKFISLDSLEIIKEFPDKLKVIYREREQIAIIKAANGEFVVDPDGYVFSEKVEGIDAPMFEDLDHEYALQSNLGSERVTFALGVVQRLSELAITPQNFVLVNIHDVSVKTKTEKETETEILFSDMKNLDVQFATLKVILEDANQKQQVFRKIDLRFERPVVTE